MKRLLAALLLLGTTVLLAAPPGWHEDFTKAQAYARRTGRPILLNFTGSDWCVWCKRMKAETLSQKPFIAYASTNLLLVEVDFPNSPPQTQALRDANEGLKQRYHVDGFPTFVLVDAEGNELGRHEGYVKGGVPAFAHTLDGWRAKMPAPTNAPPATAATSITKSPPAASPTQ